MARKPDEKRKSDDKQKTETSPQKMPKGRDQGVEVPGHTPSHDAGKERRPATGPGGAKPEGDLRGTEASGKPGAINSPYPGDDMNTNPNIAP